MQSQELRTLLEQSGMTQESLAESLPGRANGRMATRTIRKYLAGDIQIPELVAREITRILKKARR